MGDELKRLVAAVHEWCRENPDDPVAIRMRQAEADLRVALADVTVAVDTFIRNTDGVP